MHCWRMIHLPREDLDNGLVTYTHGAGEDPNDSFSFTVSDGNSTISEEDFSFSITPVNDEPSLDTNSGLTLEEGGTEDITIVELSASDVDNDDGEIIFEINSPANGSVLLDGSELTDGDSFTQQDIASGNVSYMHDDTETTSDSFSFGISNSAGTGIGTLTFNITITLVNEPPELTINSGLELNEGTSKTITIVHLDTFDESGDEEIVFTVVNYPENGTLTNDTNPIPPNDALFTQGNVNNADIAYEHDGSETESDSFTFTLTDGLLASITKTFSIDITPVNDSPVIVTNNVFQVENAFNGSIPNTVLNTTDADNPSTEISYMLTSLPANGTIGNKFCDFCAE